MKNKALNELRETFYGTVKYTGHDEEYYYFELTYIDGEKQDYIRVNKFDGMVSWKPVEGNQDWMNDFKIKLAA